MIEGLHSCKPGNEPTVGQVKTFVVIENPAKGDKKAWTKIKSEFADKGGTPYMITSVSPTGFTDKYGNISFNLSIEPPSGGSVSGGHTESDANAQRGRTAAAPLSKDDYWTRKEERDIESGDRQNRCHAQNMALRLFELIGGLQIDDKEMMKKIRDTTDWFQRDSMRPTIMAEAKKTFNATEVEGAVIPPDARYDTPTGEIPY